MMNLGRKEAKSLLRHKAQARGAMAAVRVMPVVPARRRNMLLLVIMAAP
jgi:hypothetical protein